MGQVPLCSSREIEKALKRVGYVRTGKGGSSHQALIRKVSGQATRVVTIPLGKREVPKGTLRSIIKQTGMTEDEFLELLGRRARRRLQRQR